MRKEKLLIGKFVNMSKSCFNCISFPNCPILKGANEEAYDDMYELFVIEYGRYCVDFKEK